MNERSEILVVDDEEEIRKVLTLLLSRQYIVHSEPNGMRALEFLRTHPSTDLVILDIMMPGLDGVETCIEMRNFSNVPVLFLTAKSAESDRVRAYSGGGDDFLPKPFSSVELLAKVSSLLRRYKEYLGKQPGIFTAGPLTVDCTAHSVTKNGEPVRLSETEYSILECLILNRGRNVSPQELYEKIWNETYLSSSSNTIMVHMMKLRHKIEEDPSDPKIIRTVWGKGYRID